jgi:hypothetical protein
VSHYISARPIYLFIIFFQYFCQHLLSFHLLNIFLQYLRIILTFNSLVHYFRRISSIDIWIRFFVQYSRPVAAHVSCRFLRSAKFVTREFFAAVAARKTERSRAYATNVRFYGDVGYDFPLPYDFSLPYTLLLSYIFRYRMIFRYRLFRCRTIFH